MTRSVIGSWLLACVLNVVVSRQNPYKKYTSFNNLEGVGGQDRAQVCFLIDSCCPRSGADHSRRAERWRARRRSQDHLRGNRPGTERHSSLLLCSHCLLCLQPTFAALQYEYKPDLGQVPVFALPQNLPLGKLADINFGGESESSFPASVAQVFAVQPPRRSRLRRRSRSCPRCRLSRRSPRYGLC